MNKEDRERLMVIKTKVRLRCLPKHDADWLWWNVSLYSEFPDMEDREYIYTAMERRKSA